MLVESRGKEPRDSTSVLEALLENLISKDTQIVFPIYSTFSFRFRMASASTANTGDRRKGDPRTEFDNC